VVEETSSPFSGLDKALIRSTSKRPTTESTPSIEDTDIAPRRSSSRPRSSDVRSSERSIERTKVRHSFDIYQDQLLALAEIQADIFRQTGKKPKVGDLVQQALDAYIAEDRKRSK
jgi:hypothetical protein